MFSRLVAATIRRSLILPVRNFRATSAVLGGGGHDHHGPLPVYQPEPGPSERTYFGEGKSGRVSSDEPYTPGPEDFGAYAGAGAFVLLTFLAVAYKTDVFSSKKGHGHHDSGKSQPASKSPEKKKKAKEHKEELKEEIHREEANEEKEPIVQSAPEATEELKSEEPKKEAHSSSPILPTPAETFAQPESAKKEPQNSSERPAEQAEMFDNRDESLQAEQTRTNKPPTPNE